MYTTTISEIHNINIIVSGTASVELMRPKPRRRKPAAAETHCMADSAIQSKITCKG
jgi:hypothetical protein